MRKKTSILMIAGLVFASLFGVMAADYVQPENFGIRPPGDVIGFTATPPGKVVSGSVTNPGGFIWVGRLATWSGTIPTDFRSSHSGKFDGTYVVDGTVPGRALTWRVNTEATVPRVELDVQKTELTLKHDRESNLEVKVTPTGLSVQEYKIMIRRDSASTWHTLSTKQKETPRKFVIAGKFKLKGMAKINGREFFSEEKSVEVKFPTYAQIVSDSLVQSATSAEWANTLEDSTPSRKRERGFWIRLNTTTDKYEHTSAVTGPWVEPGQQAYMILGPGPPDVPADPAPSATGATYTVAAFHTHPPMTYAPARYERSVGPSQVDERFHIAMDVVGVIYDYVESPAGSGIIPSGHPENSPARLYHCRPRSPKRRSTP